MSATTAAPGTQADPATAPPAGDPKATTPATTTTTSATTAAPPAGGKKDELEELSPAELARIVKDLRRENATARTKLKGFEEAEEAKKAAELSEIEKRDKRIAELEPLATAAEATRREYTLKDAIGETVGTKDFPATLAPGVSAAKVLKLLDATAVEWSEAGQPTNVRPLLAALAKSDPYLFARQRVPSADGGAGAGGGGVQPSMNQILRAKWLGEG